MFKISIIIDTGNAAVKLRLGMIINKNTLFLENFVDLENKSEIVPSLCIPASNVSDQAGSSACRFLVPESEEFSWIRIPPLLIKPSTTGYLYLVLKLTSFTSYTVRPHFIKC
jgi:hypothetical protein